MKQKLLASAMALAMVLSLTPVTALAAEGEDTTLPEEEITVQTETPAEEIPVEEPAEPETPVEEIPVEKPAEPETPAEEIPVEEPAEPEIPAEEIPVEEPAEPETPAEEPVEPEVPVEEVTETENTITLSGNISGSYTITEPSTIVVQGNAVLTKADGGADNAFTINANTTLEFDSGASLTLSGYTNGFAVSNATLSGGGWVINDGDGMYLFKLNTGGKLNITGNVDLNGKDKTEATASRAIFLPWGTSGQAVTLGENVTLAATNFYRGLETGGASDYTISGAWMNSSEFDFSNNNCGMALSYFDSNARFEDCTLEVSNCTASGIFMRQDNAALDGLYIDNVNINCVNDIDLDQTDIAIRFHSNNFEITDSVINIENAWNTGLWICDGWNVGEKEISNTEITVKHVEDRIDNGDDPLASLYSSVSRRKAITLVPFGDWTITGCEIVIDGESSASANLASDLNQMEGGINIASDIHPTKNGSNNPMDWGAIPGMNGGHIYLKNSSVTTSGVIGADIGTQIGQWLEIGENVVFDNGFSDDHCTFLCDTIENGYVIEIDIGIMKIPYALPYNTSGMAEEDKADKRISITGGSVWAPEYDSVDNKFSDYYDPDCAIPVNANNEELAMFAVSEEAFATYADADGNLTFTTVIGTEQKYGVSNASSDGYRYIWAPAVTVTIADTGEVVSVPQGAPYGLTQTLGAGTWYCNGSEFTASSVVMDDITIATE